MILHLMLGTACNWKCGYCLQLKQPGFNKPYDPSFAKRLVEYLDANDIVLERVDYQGGEPCLYFDEIRSISDEIGGRTKDSRFVTNGSLLNEEIIEYLNANNFFVNLSYHEGQLSDKGWETALRIRRLHVTSLIHSKCLTQDRYFEKQNWIREQYGRCVNWYVYNLFNVNSVGSYILTKEDIDKYIVYLRSIFPKTLNNVFYAVALNALFYNEFGKDKHYNCACFNDDVLSIDLSGNQYICHHACDKSFCVGNIFKDGPARIKINTLHEKCYSCELRKHCNGGCMREVNDTSCYFVHKLYELKTEYERWLNEI